MCPARTASFDEERRRFLRHAGGTGLAVGVGAWLASCGFSDGGDVPAGTTEERTHYIDLSAADRELDYYLVAGTRHHPLAPLTSAQAAAVQGGARLVGGGRVTHAVTATLPADSAQVCYVKGVPRGAPSTHATWTMPLMFYHLPTAAVAAVQGALRAGGTTAPGRSFARMRAGLEDLALAGMGVGTARAESYNYCTDPSNQALKTYFEHALALVCNHPEIGSFDAQSLVYVHQIACADATVAALAASLAEQGPASIHPGGWATLVPVNDNNGKPMLDENGQPLYVTQHSAQTLQDTGAAIRSVLAAVKNDPRLGANITDLDPEALNEGLHTSMWVVRNGSATKTEPPQARAPGSATTTWTADDESLGPGCSIEFDGASGRTVHFTVRNWYLRYLGLYVRFYNGAGETIDWEDLDSATRAQFKENLSTSYSGFLKLINQELVILGIPLKQAKSSFSVTVPEMAASIEIQACGLGTGGPPIYDVFFPQVGPAAAMTILLDLAIPGVFLALGACATYGAFCSKMALASSTSAFLATAQFMATAVTDSVLLGFYGNPENFLNLAAPFIGMLVGTGIWLKEQLDESLKEGRVVAATASTFSFGIGLAAQAVLAAGTLVSIDETMVEIANSPWQYSKWLKATHPLTVTIYPDSKDSAGFPATATYCRLYAYCDGNSTIEGSIDMPATTRTDPLTYTFLGLPAGGKVNVKAVLYSRTGWLAGAGETGLFFNTVDEAIIKIQEQLVPLTSSTEYSHKQKIVLDGAGHHQWQAADAPLVQTNCDNASGNLCELVGITLSEHFGALGYAWRASNAAVRDFDSGAAGGQLYQFANLSFTAKPESGYLPPAGGFGTPARLAYDLTSTASHSFYIDSSGGANLVRRIAFTSVGAPPSVDGPASNRAVGRFNHPSDGFLIHPTGKLLSINTALSKLEVLVPTDAPVEDAAAPRAQAYSGPGTRDGLLLGPACIAATPGGAILVLEQANNRIQAFDTGANPSLLFANGTSCFMALREEGRGSEFMDLAVEAVGYIYVLRRRGEIYTLDIYDPRGAWLTATTGVNAGKLTLDMFRNLYTLNFELLTPVGAVTEPSISQWIPSTPHV